MSDLVVVRVNPARGVVEGWALTLVALGIPHRIDADLHQPGAFALLVPMPDLARAADALDATDAEDRARSMVRDVRPPDRGRPIAPLLALAAIAVFHGVTGPRASGATWFSVGSADADAILRGDWWRAVTALTLHADAVHLAGNVIAGLIFLSAVARWLGGGLALWVALVAGTVGNLANALYHGGAHSSVGASTAVFGVLGVLGGLQLRHRLQHGRATGPLWRRVLPVTGACLAIFAMLGVGGGNVDVSAHAWGLGAGFATGLGVSFLPAASKLLNAVLATLGFAAVGTIWRLALSGAHP
jgi:membrane associated rhomboid family serine protease